MERPRKRPRLSMFADEAPDDELDSARHQNDRFLKGRFEAIFEKYERDFSGIGDEVNLATGEILLDNGHLAGLDEDADTRSEADESVGEPTPRSIRQFMTPKGPITRGRAMLRAMTVAPDRGDSYFENDDAQEVIESIEAIAQTAADKENITPAPGLRTALVIPESDVESDEDQVESETETESDHESRDDAREPVQPSRDSERTESSVHEGLEKDESATAESDTDSLFDDLPERASSPDSLFEETTVPGPVELDDQLEESIDLIDDVSDLDRDAIIARFGEIVGQQVFSLIQRRDKAELHIEKAWRIPVHLEQENLTVAANETVAEDLTRTPESPHTPRQGTSLWTAGITGARRLELHQERSMRVVRAESEDPLQDGFAEGGEVQVRVAEVSIDRGKRLLNRGTCPFCKEQFYSLQSALQHLRKILGDSSDIEPDSAAQVHRVEGLRQLLDAVEEAASVHDKDESVEQLGDDHILMDSVEAGVAAFSSASPQPAPEVVIDSDDELFQDMGYIHSDVEEDKGALHSSNSFRKLPAPPGGVPQSSLEIPDSDDEPETWALDSPLQLSMASTPESEGHSLLTRFQGLSARRRRRTSSNYEPPEEVPDASNTGSEAQPTPFPPLRETADPHDRDGDEEYQDRNVKYSNNDDPGWSLPSLRRAAQRRAMKLPAMQREAPSPANKTKSPHVYQLRTISDNAVDTSMRTTDLLNRAQLAAEDQALPLGSDDEESSREYHTPLEIDDEISESSSVSEELGADIDLEECFSPVRFSASPEDEIDEEILADDDGESVDSLFGHQEPETEAIYDFNVEDFKSLVIMHEVEGHDLAAVGEQMTDHFYSYRLEIDPRLGRVQSTPWTKEDDTLLTQLSSNPKTLMETIRRRLRHFSQTDIGNRLAERWLAEANGFAEEHEPPTLPEIPTDHPLLLLNQREVRITRLSKARHFQLLALDEDAAVLNAHSFTPFEQSRRKGRADPISRRVCRQQSPNGTWRGCGKVFSSRHSVNRHWKTSNEACLKPGFDRFPAPSKQKRNKATVGEGVQCRSTSPGGTEMGCGVWFKQKSTMYRHWRGAGRACRPSWHKAGDATTASDGDGEQVGDELRGRQRFSGVEVPVRGGEDAGRFEHYDPHQ